MTPLSFFGGIAMIQNLNQMTFQKYGTVLPERTQSAKIEELEERKSIQLRCGDGPVFFTDEQVWLINASGNSVLSVSEDGQDYCHFYLDKLVCVRAGIYFALTAPWSVSVVDMAAKVTPRFIGTRNMESLKVERKINVEGIYTFFYHEKEQGFLFAGESHPMMELTYVDQGSLHSVADGLDLQLKQGELVFYGPGQWHMQYADVDMAPRYVTITFAAEGLDYKQLLNRKFAAPQRVASLLQQMLREQERMDEYSGDVIISQLTMLLVELVRDATAPAGGKLQTSNAIHSENEIIRRAQMYVSTHVREKLTVPLLARQVDVSPSYLTALFHKNLQISPGEYIRRIKLQESKQMIRENDLNFTEIAAALQYSTVHHFSRQFKEKFGITPTEYAKSVR